MDVVEQIKKRYRRAGEAILNELRVSHGVDNVTISVKETAKSITVTIRESGETPDPSPAHQGGEASSEDEEVGDDESD